MLRKFFTRPKSLAHETDAISRLFISYSTKDQLAAIALAAKLAERHYDVWFDQQLVGGDNWWQSITTAIRTADIFLFLLTTTALDSIPCQREYSYAAALHKRIVPVMVQTIDLRQLPAPLQVIQVVDYRQQDDAAWASLQQALTHLPAPQPLPRRLPPPPPAPLSPLGALGEQIRAPQLTLEEQAAIVLQLKGLLHDPETAAAARSLLQVLSQRRDVLASVAVEINDTLTTPSADTARATRATGNSISLNVAALPATGKVADNRVTYVTFQTPQSTNIKPYSRYLEALRTDVIVPAAPLSMLWQWSLPALDIKLVNNTARTLFFTEATLQVAASQPDTAPLLLVGRDLGQNNARHLLLFNDGWGAARDVTVNCNIVPFTTFAPPAEFGTTFPYTLSIDSIEDRHNFDISDLLAQAGADMDALVNTRARLSGGKWTGSNRLLISDSPEGQAIFERTSDGQMIPLYTRSALREYQQQHLGPFTSRSALVYGVLRYTGTTVDGQTHTYQTRFYAEVRFFNEEAGGAALPPGPQYTTELQTAGTDYTLQVPIAQVVKAGEADRFSIHLGAQQSSHHRFTLALRYNDSEQIASLPCDVQIFIPRTEARKLQSVTPLASLLKAPL